MCVGNGTLRLDRHNCTYEDLYFLTTLLYGDMLYGFMFTVYTVNNISTVPVYCFCNGTVPESIRYPLSPFSIPQRSQQDTSHITFKSLGWLIETDKRKFASVCCQCRHRQYQNLRYCLSWLFTLQG